MSGATEHVVVTVGDEVAHNTTGAANDSKTEQQTALTIQHTNGNDTCNPESNGFETHSNGAAETNSHGVEKPSGNGVNGFVIENGNGVEECGKPTEIIETPLEARTKCRAYDVSFSNIHYHVAGKHVLKGVYGSVQRGKILGIMGETGSGKTTLLHLLANRIQTGMTGDILFNGKPFTKDVRHRVGFVEQEDVLLSELTISQTLTFTARLRLSAHMSPQQIKERVQEVVALLRLERVRESTIGNQLIRGVSGGEKKRVAICNEMLSNPSILFLDEPTSGLDSSTAFQLFSCLKDMVMNDGITILMAIHQPSSQIFQQFDQLLVLTEGRTAYFGGAADALTYFHKFDLICPPAFNPADFLVDLAVSGKVIPHLDVIAEDAIQLVTAQQKETPPSESADDRQRRASYLQQIRILSERSFMLAKAALFTKDVVVQQLCIAFLTAIAFGQLPFEEKAIQWRFNLVFWSTATWTFFPILNVLGVFPTELSMLRKEVANSSYRLSAYFIARTVVVAFLDLIFPSFYITIIWWMTSVNLSFVSFVELLFFLHFQVLVGHSWGYLISAAVPASRMMTTVIIFLTFTFSFAGFLVPVPEIPVWIRWAEHLSVVKYQYNAWNKIVFSDDIAFQCAPVSSFLTCPITSEPILALAGIGTSVGYSVGIMAAIGLALRGLAFFALRRSVRNA